MDREQMDRFYDAPYRQKYTPIRCATCNDALDGGDAIRIGDNYYCPDNIECYAEAAGIEQGYLSENRFIRYRKRGA